MNKSNNAKHLSFTKNRFLVLSPKDICYTQDTKYKLVEGLEELSPFAEHVLRPFTQSQVSGLGVRPKKGTQRLVF